MKSAERKNCASLSSIYRGWLKSPIAHLLVLALIVPSLPASAQVKSQVTPQPDAWHDKSCDLPGMCQSHTGLIVGVAVGGAAAVALIVWAKHHNGGAKLSSKPVKFPDFVPGQPAKLNISLANTLNMAITVKEIAVEDPSGALKLGDVRQGTFILARGEKYDIPVTLNTNNNEGKARIRIVVTGEKAKKDVVEFINVSYGHGAAKHHKLIPKL